MGLNRLSNRFKILYLRNIGHKSLNIYQITNEWSGVWK